MKNLLFTTPELLLPEKAAIVGSSGILIASKYGKLIDSFDCVVRFNRAPTIGFEEDVGSKTDIYVVNNHVFTNQEISGSGWTSEHYPTQPQFFVRDLKNTNIYCIGQDLPSYSEVHRHTSISNGVFYFDYSQMECIRNEFGFAANLGVGTCFIILCILSNVEVSLFGIDMADRRRDHYWEERPPAGPCHNISNEKAVLNKLSIDKMVHINV